MDLGAAVETLPLLTGVARRQELKASLSKFMIGMRRQASVDPLAGGEYSLISSLVTGWDNGG